jgi:1,2-phenylacetyl-CoA epoxidase PaaB subunit
MVGRSASTPSKEPEEPEMPRKLRIHVAGGFYHVTLRGNHRRDIFRDPADRALMESLVADATLGALMQRIARPYARDVHRRVDTTGHLFARRHAAIMPTSAQPPTRG